MNRNKHINLVFSCDENYIKLLVPCIISVIDNKNVDTSIDIFILETGISNYHKGKIKELEIFNDIKNIKIEFINVEEKAKGLIVVENYHLTNATLYRLLIPQIFASKGRVLYLDVDIIVQKDLLEIYNTDFEGNYLVASKGYFPTKADTSIKLYYQGKYYDATYVYKEMLEIQEDLLTIASYINGGVMLFNNEKIIEDKKDKELLEIFFQYKDYLLFADQDVIMKSFLDKTKDLGWEKHVGNKLFEDLQSKSLVEYVKYVKQSTIIHFIHKKLLVLKKAFKLIFADTYFKYLQMSYLALPQWQIWLAKINTARKYFYRRKMWSAIPHILFSSYKN